MSIVEEVRQELDETLGGVFWPDSQVFNAVNESQLVEALVPGWQIAETEVTLDEGEEDVELPSSVMIPLGFRHKDTDETPCYATTEAKLDAWNPEWRLVLPGKPLWFRLWGLEAVKFWPSADKAYTFILRYIPWPATEVGESAQDVTSYPSLLRQALVHRSAGKLMGPTMPGFAEGHLVEAAELEQKFRVQLRNQQSLRVRTFVPDSGLNAPRSGAVGPQTWYI